jgi:membrane protein
MLRTRDELVKRTREYWMQVNPSTRALPTYLGRALSNFFKHDMRQAAALAYYAVFSVFPLTLLFAVAISGILGPTVAEEQIQRALGLFVPNQTLSLFQSNVEGVLTQSRSFGAIAVAGLIWSGLGLFTNVTSSLDLIFHVPASRSIWHQRLVALALAIALIVLISTSFITSGVLRLVSAISLDRPSVWLLIGTIMLPFSIDMVIFALLFRYVPATHVRWDAVWPSAIFGALGWELLKAGFNWYLNNIANFQFVYGSLVATVIVLMFWAYLLASNFLLAAEICTEINEWMGDQYKKEEAEAFLHSRLLSELPDGTEPSPDGEPALDGLIPPEQIETGYPASRDSL